MEKQLLPKVAHYDMMADPFRCDFSSHLTMGQLGNAMLNAADFHSDDRHFGMSYLHTIHRTWVLSRLSIELEAMPRAYDKFFIETWVDGAMKFFTSRNFKIGTPDGRIYGYGRSMWAMIDTESRQPANLFEVNDGLITAYIEADYPCPMAKPSRVKLGEGLELVRQLDTYYSDVDVNGHVNSVKYIDHVLDLWPLSWYESHRLRRIDVAYVAESHYGDKLKLYRESLSEDGLTVGVSVCKLTPEGEEREVCRCAVQFE